MSQKKVPKTFLVWAIFPKQLDVFTWKETQECAIPVFRKKLSRGKKIVRRAFTLLLFSILKVVLQMVDIF